MFVLEFPKAKKELSKKFVSVCVCECVTGTAFDFNICHILAVEQ